MQPSCSQLRLTGTFLPSWTWDSPVTQKLIFSLGSLKQQGLTMQLWHRTSAMRWDLMDNWGAGALGNGWKILLEQGCSLSWSQGNLDPGKSVGSHWILPPESLSPLFQTWQSLEMKGFKEKCSIPDTQVIFHTGFSFFPASKASPVSSKWSSAWAASQSSPGTASDARCQMKAGWKSSILPECITAELKAFLQHLPGHLLGPDQIQWVTEPEFGHSCVVCA